MRVTFLNLVMGFFATTLSLIPDHTVLADPHEHEANNQRLSPFQATYLSSINTPFTFQVPSEQVLVIEELSAACFSSIVDVRLFATSNGSTAQYTFAPIAFSPTYWISTQTTRIYADPGTTVTVGSGGFVPPNANCVVSIAGHLVNTQ